MVFGQLMIEVKHLHKSLKYVLKLIHFLLPGDQSVPQTPSSGGGQPFAAVRTSIKGPAPPIPANTAQTNRGGEKSQQVSKFTVHWLYK